MEEPIYHQWLTIHKASAINEKKLENEFMSEENKNKREKYRITHTKEQEKEIYSKWTEFMNKIREEVSFFEYVEKLLGPK